MLKASGIGQKLKKKTRKAISLRKYPRKKKKNQNKEIHFRNEILHIKLIIISLQDKTMYYTKQQ